MAFLLPEKKHAEGGQEIHKKLGDTKQFRRNLSHPKWKLKGRGDAPGHFKHLCLGT